EYIVKIKYTGNIPRMFRINQEIIATGRLNSQNIFIADKILVKHDEVYSPVEPTPAKTSKSSESTKSKTLTTEETSTSSKSLNSDILYSQPLQFKKILNSYSIYN
ncbi:MAG: cytochrome c maturation protein CcmE, partial [Pseudomonadota bacterium]